MAVKKRHWFWNLLMVITVIVCISALVMHYKNWIKLKPDQVQILSGFYKVDVAYADLDSIKLIEKIPPMQRLNGFSALEKEKGIFQEFKDSLTDKKVYVFVDNISQQKIKLIYRDSIKLYVNHKDSLKTLELFDFLHKKLESEVMPN
jgi:flagellar motor component MotA